MADGGSPRAGAPASRQLYIRTHGRRPRDERDIADVFQRYGEVRYVRLMPQRDSGFVSYWRTRDACEAREALHERSVNGMTFDVQFSRATRLLHIDAVPETMSRSAVINLINSEFLRFGPLQLVDLSRDRRIVYITFQREADAIQSVAALQGHSIGNWKWEIEFHKERLPNSSSSSELPLPHVEANPPALPPLPPRSIRILENGEGPFAKPGVPSHPAPHPMPLPPPAASAAPQRLSITRSELAKRASQRNSVITSPVGIGAPPEQTIKPEQAPIDKPPPQNEPPSPRAEPSPPRRSEASPPRRRSRSRSRTPPRSRSLSPKAKHRRRSKSPDSSSDSGRSRSPSPARKRRLSRSPSPAAVPSHTCDRCEELIGHWHKNHSERDEEMCKKIVAAWFKGNYEVLPEDTAQGGAVSMRRSVFLQKELNPFLRSLGFRAWNPTSTLYTEWFLRELLGLTASQLRRSHDLHFLRRTSRAGYRDMLQSLLKDLGSD